MNASAQLRRFPSVEEVRELPLQLEHRIPPEWEDRNGHVNVQFYLALFEMGGWKMLEDVGIDETWFRRNAYSIFDLEHHLHYLAETAFAERELDTAIDYANRAIRLEDSEYRFHYTLAQLRYQEGEKSRARKALDRALQLAPEWVDTDTLVLPGKLPELVAE